MEILREDVSDLVMITTKPMAWIYAGHRDPTLVSLVVEHQNNSWTFKPDGIKLFSLPLNAVGNSLKSPKTLLLGNLT